MEPTVQAASLMMIAALPTMFLVIAIFIFLTKLLVKAFPAGNEEDD
jgi:hypothetical protein